MPEKDRPSVKDDERYEALREEGANKEKAARIANTPRHEAGKRGGEAKAYEEWTKDELYGGPRRSESRAGPTWTKTS